MNWNDIYEDLDEQASFDLIPQGTMAKVMMNIKRGGHNDSSRAWTGDYATRNPDSGSVYLNVEFTVLTGKYTNRKIWSKIGLHSEKGEQWSRMGRAFVRGIMSSKHGVSQCDKSAQTQKLCKINSFADIDGIIFLARIDVEKDRNGNDRNVINRAIAAEHNNYSALMSASINAAHTSQQTQPTRPSPVGYTSPAAATWFR
jgi:hypothetical protein